LVNIVILKPRQPGTNMQIYPTRLAGVMLVTVSPNKDERGLFARTYDSATFAAAGLPTTWPQCNTSWNATKGTLRGLHFQAAPRPDPKVVRCTRGRIFDVVVDLRPGSPTFRGWTAAELSEANRNAFAIPAGCAHGFLTMEHHCEVLYMMGEVYVPELACGVRWNDPAFSIEWPTEPMTVSERDRGWPDFVP
jgi:dTDP-4-dehydrorhamnose 3,5-epimerase